jgi:glycosyltransferase involved in cell wall biosynthesis
MIRLVCYSQREDGWGRLARGLGGALNEHEKTELVDWGFHRAGRGSLLGKFRTRRDGGLVTISLGPNVTGRAFLAGRYRVVCYTGETTRIPESHRHHLSHADMIWTPSDWGRRILEQNGIAAGRVRVLPLGVDAQLFVPPIERDGRTFRFLCVGKWERRKGSRELVRAFVDEFDAADPVELVMHCGSPWPRAFDYREAIVTEVRRKGSRAPRVIASDPVPPEDLVRLMQRCHAFVLPTRGEGWGLPVLEAMACGLPCIVTNYGGVTEFAHERNSYLVRVAGMRAVDDPEFYDPAHDWGEWAEPDFGELRRLMRHVFENREEAREKGRLARRDAEALWTWDRAAETAMTCIAELRGSRQG